MIWKLRGTRPPTRGGIPACPTFWSGNHLHTSRARPLTGARSRPAEESDDHVFITYRSPQDFSLKVPASWTRTETPSNVVFEDQHHRIEVSIVDVTATALAGRGRPVRFATSPRAVAIRCVGVAKLPAGRSIQIRFTSVRRSPAVNKEIHLEGERYLITGCGKIAVLTLCAPAVVQAGDLWKMIADSFRW